MSDYTLNIIVQGQDNASAPLHEVSVQLKGVGDAADSAAGQSGGFFSNLLSTAGGFIAANVIGTVAGQFKDFIAGGLEDARNTLLLNAQTEQVLKTTGNLVGMTTTQITDMATAMSDAAGKSLFGDDQIQASQNMLLTFTNIGHDVFPQATQATVDMAQALHKTPEAMSMMIGKALNSADGFTALKKSGVAFTDSQEQQIKTLFASGHAAEAQQIILGELNKEFGGQAAAAAKATGGMAELKGRMGEAAEAIGTALLPVIGVLGNLLLTNVIPVIEKAAAWLGENLPGAIATLTAAVGPVLASFSQMGSSGSALGGALGNLSSVWSALQPVIVNVTNAVGALVMAVFGQVQAFLDAHGADIKATLTDAWTQIMAIIKLGIALYNAIVPPVLTAIAGFIKAHGAQIQAIFGATWAAIKALIDGALTLIRGVLTAALQLIQGDWSGAWETIKQMSARIVTDIGTVIKAGLNTILALFGSSINDIKKAWDGLVSDASTIGANIMQGVLDGLRGKWDEVIAWLNDKLRAAQVIWNTITGSGGGGGGGSSDAPPARASGGPVGAGQTYLVGEQGPELFTPRSSGAILSAPSTAGLFGGGAATYNQTFLTISPGAIVITGQPGQNADQLAEMVIKKITDKMTLRRN